MEKIISSNPVYFSILNSFSGYKVPFIMKIKGLPDSEEMSLTLSDQSNIDSGK